MLASDFAPPPPRHMGAVGKGLSMVLLYGVLWPIAKLLTLVRVWPPFPAIESYAKAAQGYRPTANDVFVCSYFKSGTTWLLQIVTQIAFRGQAEFDNIHHVVPWIETPGPLRKTSIALDDPSPSRRSPTGLRAIKTHFVFPLVPKSPEARYISMTRDPKAVAVSGYHFIKAMSLGPMMPSFRYWIGMFLSPKFFQGSWAAHLASYWARRDDAHVLFLTYEDLRADLGTVVDRIAAFMEVELSETERTNVLEKSSFAYMKTNGLKFDPGKILPWTMDGAMIRAGGSGKTDRLLTAEVVRQIDDHFRAELHALGCDFDYDAAYCRS